jgi:cytochrome c peroxidase
MELVRLLTTDASYKTEYEAIFGQLPNITNTTRFPDRAAPIGSEELSASWDSMTDSDRGVVNTAIANLGKAIAAYERMLQSGPTRFDNYVVEIEQELDSSSLSDEEIIGLQLFISDARCTECHNGPLFTNNEFHNTGVLSFPDDHPDRGRIDGLKKLLADPFNCRGEYSNDPLHQCDELAYVRTGIELIGATRTPSLRNLGGTAPYSHKGQHATLAEVIDLYNRAPLAMIGHNEAEEKLGLSRRERKQLEAFLNALDAPIAANPKWLKAPE